MTTPLTTTSPLPSPALPGVLCLQARLQHMARKELQRQQAESGAGGPGARAVSARTIKAYMSGLETPQQVRACVRACVR